MIAMGLMNGDLGPTEKPSLSNKTGGTTRTEAIKTIGLGLSHVPFAPGLYTLCHSLPPEMPLSPSPAQHPWPAVARGGSQGRVQLSPTTPSARTHSK